MHPIHGFSADLNSSLVIFSATLLHLPVSTTHVVSGSIMGVGSAERVKAVHWDVARQMVTAWVMTIPCTALMGALAPRRAQSLLTSAPILNFPFLYLSRKRTAQALDSSFSRLFISSRLMAEEPAG